jgi:hypothetical protein
MPFDPTCIAPSASALHRQYPWTDAYPSTVAPPPSASDTASFWHCGLCGARRACGYDLHPGDYLPLPRMTGCGSCGDFCDTS